jgi:hypothetical protein
LKLHARIVSAFVWIAAFCLAGGVFLSLTLLLKNLPPTAPVATGVVTILRYSKLQDYVTVALFFLLVPPLTIWLHRVFERTGATLLSTVPYLLSPIFFLTTGKVGWILGIPIALSLGGPRALAVWQTRRWLRAMFRRELHPHHALLFAEGLSWILFRYIVLSRRIAHIPTLFLEFVFVAAFLALFWAAAILIARLAELLFAENREDVFKRITVAALPLVVLPFISAIWMPLIHARAITAITIAVIAILAFVIRKPFAPRTAWNLAAYLIFPALVYLVSYASTAQGSQWVDLFHRGEAIGPASDYLRGKVPFRDVFALHGMLEDGLLDSWLMDLFGRSLDVHIARTVIIGALLGVSLWFLGIVVFDSIPLALFCVAMGSWTTVENNRTFFQVAAVALFWNAVKRRSRASAIFAGVFAGIAIFFSYDIGLYTIAGAIGASLLLWIAAKRAPLATPSGAASAPGSREERIVLGEITPSSRRPRAAAAPLFFAIGVLLGAAPFIIYLAMRGALDDFAVTSFVIIPRIIDATWALPFPDLVSTFRRDLNLHTLADFVLLEKFHLILSPLTIAVALVYFIQRWRRKRVDQLDYALLVLTVFAAITQRTAFGRAEFRHQYFAAFLIGPILILLASIAFRALREIWRDGDSSTRVFLAALAAATVPAIAVLFWIPDLINVRLNDLVAYTTRVQHLKIDDPLAEEVRWRIHDVTEEVKALTPRGEPIFDFSNQPAFYFFTDRPNPTRFYQVPILSPREFQAETIGALERAKPKVIIRRSPERYDQFDGVPNELRAQAVAAYLRDAYEFHKTTRGVELWTRRRDARPLVVAQYLRAIRLPDAKALVSSGMQRLVFPAIGSNPGVGGSYWQSDLTMHNPYREPLTATLRFVANDRGIDRAITLAPRQTLRWPDVVKTLFGAGGVGTLWVEHRENRAPVAIVKTADVAHGGRASIEPALSARDAAAAGTESAELAIVGIPAATAEGHRVNVGVVNIGNFPATFRITARTRTGQAVGRPIESGVFEDQVWILNDLEHAIGAKIDDTMTVRVQVIAGTGVAFATVVQPGGDSEFIAAIPAQQQ